MGRSSLWKQERRQEWDLKGTTNLHWDENRPQFTKSVVLPSHTMTLTNYYKSRLTIEKLKF